MNRDATKILVLDGAPRAGGYTRQLVDLLAGGARAAGAATTLVRLADREVRACRGCYACWSDRTPGRCVQRDDMDDLLPRFAAADVLVLATPVYYYSFSAILKAFIERLLPTTRPGIARGRTTGIGRNRLRDPEGGPDRAALLAVGAHRDLDNMRGIVESFRLICEGIDAAPAGELLRPESYLLDFAASKPVTHRRVLGAFEAAGRQLARGERIDPATEADARAAFTQSPEAFGRHFATYWEIAAEIGSSGSDRERLRAAAAEDLRILMPEMASCYNATAGGDLKAVLLFDLADADERWHLAVEGGRCRAVRGDHPAPTTTLSLDRETLVDLLMQRLDVRRAVADRRVRASGDRSLLARLPRLFPPPAV